MTTHSTARPQGHKAQPEYLDLSALLQIVLRNKARIGWITLAVFAVGVTYAVVAKPAYQANLLIKVDATDQGDKRIPQNLSAIFDLRSAPAAELEMLRSRSVVAKAVESTKLDVIAEPKRLPVFGQWIARGKTELSIPGILGFGGYAWGNESITLGAFNVPDALLKKPITLTVHDANSFSLDRTGAASVRGQVGSPVTLETPDGAVDVQVTSLHANPGTQFLLTRTPFADAVEQLQKDLVIGELGRQSGMISVSLKNSRPEIASDVLNAVGRQYIAQNVNLKSEEAERSLSFLEGQLPALKAAIDDAEGKYNQYRNKRGTADLAEETKSSLQQSVQAQVSLLELRKSRSELVTRYQPENPLIRALDQQIATVTGELGSINAKIRRVPDTEQELVALTRDVKVSTTLYASLLQTAQQLKLAQASQSGSAKLIDTAIQPATPIGPKRLLIAAASAGIGLVLGLFAALVRRPPVTALVHQDELSRELTTPVRGLVPYSQAQLLLANQVMTPAKRVNVLAEEDTQDGAIESLRIFCTTLQFSTLHAKNNVIAIVGPTSGVGKSFIAANLSAILASTKKRVLLIDADLRGGHLHRYFGVERATGLSEVINHHAEPAKVIHANVLPNLDFIATGELPERPADALANGVLGSMLRGAAPAYDYIVIDTPPVLAVADSLVVAQQAGLVFCVVRKNKSTTVQVQESETRFANSGIPIAGLIFNGAKASDVSYGYRTERRIDAGDADLSVKHDL